MISEVYPLISKSYCRPGGADDGRDSHRARDRLESDGVHSLRVQLRHPRQARRRERPSVRADPRRQGPSRLEGLHLSEGAPPGPLSKRPGRARAPSAAAPRGRLIRGDRLGHRDHRSRRAARRRAQHVRWRDHPLLWRRRSRQPSRRFLRHGDAARVRGEVPVERDRAREDW